MCQLCSAGAGVNLNSMQSQPANTKRMRVSEVPGASSMQHALQNPPVQHLASTVHPPGNACSSEGLLYGASSGLNLSGHLVRPAKGPGPTVAQQQSWSKPTTCTASRPSASGPLASSTALGRYKSLGYQGTRTEGTRLMRSTCARARATSLACGGVGRLGSKCAGSLRVPPSLCGLPRLMLTLRSPLEWPSAGHESESQ